MNPAHLSEQIDQLFAYITREKNKFYRQARKTRLTGALGNHEIQMSELILWRRLKRVFSGFFIYISNTEEPNSAAIQTITQLNGTWSYTGNNLYMAFPSAHKFFEIKIEKSNHSIDIVREQVAFLIAVAYLYYLIFEAIFHITLGKALARTSIIAVSGHPPRFKDILIRSFARFIPFAPLAYINSEVGFHDKLSKTRVVRSDIDPVNIKETYQR